MSDQSRPSEEQLLQFALSDDPELQALVREHERAEDFERDLVRSREYRRRYPLRDYGAKERSRCRRAIVALRLKPYPAADAWDGYHAIGSTGRRCGLSEGMRKQMRQMLLEGFWQ